MLLSLVAFAVTIVGVIPEDTVAVIVVVVAVVVAAVVR